jgi:hypothetical protein
MPTTANPTSKKNSAPAKSSKMKTEKRKTKEKIKCKLICVGDKFKLCIKLRRVIVCMSSRGKYKDDSNALFKYL